MTIVENKPQNQLELGTKKTFKPHRQEKFCPKSISSFNKHTVKLCENLLKRQIKKKTEGKVWNFSTKG